MANFRCISSITNQVNPRGFKQVVTEYYLKNGNMGTEIVTTLDAEGNKGIRTIERDCIGIPKKIIDDVYGRHEEYISAHPEYPTGIFQLDKNNIKTYYPNVSLEHLSRY